MLSTAATGGGRATINADAQLKDWSFAPIIKHPITRSYQYCPTPRPTGLGFRVVGTLLKGGKVTDRGAHPFYSTEIQSVDNTRQIKTVNSTVYSLKGHANVQRTDIPSIPDPLKQIMVPFIHALTKPNWPSNAEVLFHQVSAWFIRGGTPSPTSSPVKQGATATPGTCDTVSRSSRSRNTSASTALGSVTAAEGVEGTLPLSALDMSPTYPQIHLTSRSGIKNQVLRC